MENLFGLGLRPDQQVRAAPLRAVILFELCVCPTCVCVATLCVPSGWVRACVVAVSASVVACLRAVGLAEERREKKRSCTPRASHRCWAQQNHSMLTATRA
jgi:hypothetical protein